RNRRGGTDHRNAFTWMCDQMSERTGRRCRQEEQEKAHCAETPCHRAAERQEPCRIHPDMHDVGMEERVANKGPDLCTRSAGVTVEPWRRLVTSRDERKQTQNFAVPAKEKGPHNVNAGENRKQCDNHAWNIEDGFGGSIHGRSLHLSR